MIDGSENVWATQFTTAAVASYLIQWLKTYPGIKLLNYDTEKLNRIASIAIGTLSGVGIFFTWNQTAGTLLITGLTAANGLHLVSKVVEQVVMQHFIYRVSIAPPKWGAVQYQEAKKADGASNGTGKV